MSGKSSRSLPAKFLLAALVALAATGGWWLLKSKGPHGQSVVSADPDAASPPEESGPATLPTQATEVDSEQRARPTGPPPQVVKPPGSAVPSTASAAQPEGLTPSLQSLFPELTDLDFNHGSITEKQALQLKQGFQALAAQGAGAIPAIRQFIEKNLDLSFGKEDAEAVGAPSLRVGVLEALRQIGGPEAVELSRQVLQTTTVPLEFAQVARNLEEAAPGQYSQEILEAARGALNAISQAQLYNVDVAPFFQALQTYGGAGVHDELRQAASQWSYYGAMALAGLPSGQGIPALIQIAQNPEGLATGNNNFALRMLAQVASQHPEAAAALVELARGNQMTEYSWLSVADGLGGNQFHFATQYPQNTPTLRPGIVGPVSSSSFGSQNLVSTPLASEASAAELDQRVAVIGQLLATTSNPTAVQALQQARARLSGPVETK